MPRKKSNELSRRPGDTRLYVERPVWSDGDIRRIVSVQKHRNGVGGRSFHHVVFEYANGDELLTLMAIVPVDGDGGECYVVNQSLEHIDMAWRGDRLRADMLKAIAGQR